MTAAPAIVSHAIASVLSCRAMLCYPSHCAVMTTAPHAVAQVLSAAVPSPRPVHPQLPLTVIMTLMETTTAPAAAGGAGGPGGMRTVGRATAAVPGALSAVAATTVQIR